MAERRLPLRRAQGGLDGLFCCSCLLFVLTLHALVVLVLVQFLNGLNTSWTLPLLLSNLILISLALLAALFRIWTERKRDNRWTHQQKQVIRRTPTKRRDGRVPLAIGNGKTMMKANGGGAQQIGAGGERVMEILV